MPIEDALRIADKQDVSAMNATDNLLAEDRIDIGNIAEDFLGNVGVQDIGDAGLWMVAVVTTALEAAVDGALLKLSLYEHTIDETITNGNEIDNKTVTVNTAGTGVTPVGTELWRRKIVKDEIDEQFIGGNFNLTVQDMAAGNISWFLTPFDQEMLD